MSISLPYSQRGGVSITIIPGGGPRVVVSTAAFHARVRGSVPGLGGLKETKMFLPHPRVKVSIVGSLRDREVACSASDRQGSNFESCVWTTVSSQSSHHPQEVLLAQFSLFVHKGGLKPDSFHFIYDHTIMFILPEFVSYLGERGGVLCVGNSWHFCTPVLMNMSNITFQVLRLSIFIFNKRAYRALVGIMLAQRRKRWPSITSALG